MGSPSGSARQPRRTRPEGWIEGSAPEPQPVNGAHGQRVMEASAYPENTESPRGGGRREANPGDQPVRVCPRNPESRKPAKGRASVGITRIFQAATYCRRNCYSTITCPVLAPVPACRRHLGCPLLLELRNFAAEQGDFRHQLGHLRTDGFLHCLGHRLGGILHPLDQP